MTLFDERIVPRLEEIRICFETPNYEDIGCNSSDIFGIDVVENGQIKTTCSIKKDYICIICIDSKNTMSLIYCMDENRIVINYNLIGDQVTEIKNVNSSPSQEGIELNNEQLQYLKDFYQYLQNKLVQYENSSN